MKKIIDTWVTSGKFHHEAEVLESAKYFESKKCTLVITDSSEEKRTIDQNKALWRWDSILAEEVGYTRMEMHYAMCCQIFGTTWVEIGENMIAVPKKTTSNLSKAEWQDYIRDYRVIARDIHSFEMPNFGYHE